MAWSRNRRVLSVLLSGGAAVAGASYVYHNKHALFAPKVSAEPHRTYSTTPGVTPLGSVLASWTTNFKPTTEWDNNWDRREPESLTKPSKTPKDEKEQENALEKARPKATRHLILIRHGQYNLDGAEDSQRYLTELGREQAVFSGKRLKELSEQFRKVKGENFKFSRIINSTMTRATETANIIYGELSEEIPRHSCDLLREGAPIPPEPPIGHWRPEPDFYQDGARIEAGFRKYFHRASPKQEEDSYEIVVCHANVIRYFVCRALQLPPEAWLRMSLHHASLTWFTIRPSGRVSLRAVGDAGHIPADKLSFS